MAEPITTAKIAYTAWRNRKTLVWVAGIALTLVMIPMFLMFSVITAITGADAYCNVEATQTTTASTISVEARKRGASQPAANLIAAYAAAAQATLPNRSYQYTGVYRLPADYAAGQPNGKGRWEGPQDPTTGDASKDSRNFTPAATRALMRSWKKTDPTTWVELQQLNITPQGLHRGGIALTAEEIVELTARIHTMLSTSFTHIPVSTDMIKKAITTATDDADQYGYGDAFGGGALILGDPERVNILASAIGARAFGGAVNPTPTNAISTQALHGAYRELAAQDGIVIILTTDTPETQLVEDTQDASLATVIWIPTSGSNNPQAGIFPDNSAHMGATIAKLEGFEGATAPGLVCDGVLQPPQGLDGATIDPALIIAPDSAAQTAIANARAQLGEPYVTNGGATPPTSWDCSKLTTYAWVHTGITLTPYTYTQWDQTQRIPRAYAQPGDLIFWFRGNAHHVAIIDEVTPDGRIFFVHAANPERGVVRDELTGGWYSENLSGFGRVQRETPPPQPEVGTNEKAA